MRVIHGLTREYSYTQPLSIFHEKNVYWLKPPAFRAHSKTVGGLPLVSDTFLLQKQQTFNRSKNLERE